MTQLKKLLMCKWERELLATLLDSGNDVILVLDDFDTEHHHLEPELIERTERVYRVSSFDALSDLSAVAADIRLRGEQIDQVISFTEFSQLGAGYLQSLVAARPTDLLDWVAVRDKRLMKERVRAAGIRTAASLSLPDANDRERREHIKRTLRFPVVVKPALGFGTMSTRRADTPEQFDRILDDFHYEPLLPSRQLTVEEFVTGRELLVEGLWVNGEPEFFVAGSYLEPRLASIGSRTGGGTTQLPDGAVLLSREDNAQLYERLLDFCRRVNAAFHVTHAVTEVELFETPDGELVFSEMCTRLGGSAVVPMVSEHLGEPVWHIIGRGLLSDQAHPREVVRRHVGFVNLSPEKPGVITTLPPVDEVAAIPGVARVWPVAKVGDTLSLSHGAEFCYIVIFGSDDRTEFDAAMKKVMTEYRVATEPAGSADPTSAR
ncbi:ATP-grasp domain-containing protein [Streptomyces sp. NPDC001920]